MCTVSARGCPSEALSFPSGRHQPGSLKAVVNPERTSSVVPKAASNYTVSLGSSNLFLVRSFSAFCGFSLRREQGSNIVWFANIPMKMFLIHPVFKNIIYLN